MRDASCGSSAPSAVEGECLFLGAAGTKRGNGDWKAGYHFASSPNVTGLTVVDITGINKEDSNQWARPGCIRRAFTRACQSADQRWWNAPRGALMDSSSAALFGMPGSIPATVPATSIWPCTA